MNTGRLNRHEPRVLLLLLGAVVAILVGCDKKRSITGPIVTTPETVSTPAAPTGDSVATPGALYHASTGGASSSAGHALQYRVDFDAGGAHRYSAWSPDTVVAGAWELGGNYLVEAQARSATDSTAVSAWSGGRAVAVSGSFSEFISPPTLSSTDGTVATRATGSYTATGAASSLGHALEYQFEFSGLFPEAPGTTTSAWTPSRTASHSWPGCSGLYLVRVRARCATHTSDVSAWNAGFLVTVTSSGAVVITDASITFTIPEGAQDASQPIYLSSAMGLWTQSGVTWANRPALSTSLSPGVRFSIPDWSFGYTKTVVFAVPVDVIQGWRSNPSLNFGLAVGDPNGTSPGPDSNIDFAGPVVSIRWHYSGEDCDRVKSLGATAVAYVDESDPSTNFGAASLLHAGSLAGKERVALVKFDPSLP